MALLGHFTTFGTPGFLPALGLFFPTFFLLLGESGMAYQAADGTFDLRATETVILQLARHDLPVMAGLLLLVGAVAIIFSTATTFLIGASILSLVVVSLLGAPPDEEKWRPFWAEGEGASRPDPQ